MLGPGAKRHYTLTVWDGKVTRGYVLTGRHAHSPTGFRNDNSPLGHMLRTGFNIDAKAENP